MGSVASGGSIIAIKRRKSQDFFYIIGGRMLRCRSFREWASVGWQIDEWEVVKGVCYKFCCIAALVSAN
jgi:hypothetical protein